MGKIKVNEIEKHDATEVTVNSDVVMAAGTSVSSPSISTDTISEKTSDSGVTVDGVLLKDNAVNTDTISEKTSGSGVTIDGVLLKDNQMAGTYLDGGIIKLASVTASNTAEIDFSTSVTGWNNTTYRSFIVRGKWIKPATDTARFYQYLASGTSKRTGTYELGTYQARVDASASGYYQQDQSGYLEIGTFQLGTGTNESMAFEMQVFPAGDSGNAPSGSIITGGFFRCILKGYNAASYSMQGGFQYNSTSYMDGIYLSMSTGNIDQGEFEFYGVK